MFANDKRAKVWKIFPDKKAEQKYTDVQLSTSRKAKNGYETDFNDIVRFIGEAHKKAANLEAEDSIKILTCGVSNFYSKEKNMKYYTFCIFDFEFINEKMQAESNDEDFIDISNVPDEELPFA